MIRILAAVLILAASATPHVWAADAAKPDPVLFDQLKGVKTWRKGGDNIVYVQGSTGDWYKAVMLETCMTLGMLSDEQTGRLAAAEAVGVTQPTLSAGIKDLEEKLLERLGASQIGRAHV